MLNNLPCKHPVNSNRQSVLGGLLLQESDTHDNLQLLNQLHHNMNSTRQSGHGNEKKNIKLNFKPNSSSTNLLITAAAQAAESKKTFTPSQMRMQPQ